MIPNNHHANIDAMNIQTLIASLYKLFNLGRAANEEIITLQERLRVVDENNPTYSAIEHDKRESTKMYWRLLIICLAVSVDWLLSFQAVSILTDEFGLPSILKILVPVFLIVVEIGISYFQAISHRSGEQAGWLVRNAQYLVLLILIGLSILLIIYTIQSYNETTDHMSFWAYLLGTLLLQVSLLIASLMLHLWIIRNSEAIAETIAHLQYKFERNKIVRKITCLQKKSVNKYTNQFKAEVHRLVQRIEFFKRQYPKVNIDFTRTIPKELLDAIEQVMGKKTFQNVSLTEAKITYQ